MWPYIDTEMASKSKELSRDILSLIGLKDRGIATGFYGKKWGFGRGMGFIPNS